MMDVDAVIAWVDGNDPAHQSKRKRYMAGQDADAEATTSTRFDQCGEIYYCIASILMYAPFVRKIWVVTDGQTPSLLPEFFKQNLCPKDKIQVVDHAELFRDHADVLPTFNSLTIESMLCFIPGLAANFIYFNDDFFFNRPQRLEDWFSDEGPVIRSNLRLSSRKKIRTTVRSYLRKLTFRPPNTRPRFGRAQETASVIAGMKDHCWSVGHYPHPIRKKVLLEFFDKHRELLRSQIEYRFRDYRQFLPVGLANHLEILENGVTPVPMEPVAYMKPGKTDPMIDAVLNDIRTGQSFCGCIQSLDRAREPLRNRIEELLSNKFAECLPSQMTTNVAALDGDYLSATN